MIARRAREWFQQQQAQQKMAAASVRWQQQ
jgi:hypothetical protein